MNLRSYPLTRLRRPRQRAWMRAMVAEHRLTMEDVIYPVFIRDGKNSREPISAMPGIERLSIDQAVKEAKRANSLGIRSLALFPYTEPAKRNAQGTEALNPDNLTCKALKAIKDAVPDLGLMTDVALDPYTDHGHDGLVMGNEILNDETVAVLCEQALLQARAGADIVAPSDMMDGRIGAVRQALEDNGFRDIMIMAYSAKYASSFYGPFREAVGAGTRLKGDKRSYQMDPANADEALHEATLDLKEGADFIMVKPGLAYLDIIHQFRNTFKVPVFAYQVSGEYSMIKAAAAQGWLNEDQAVLEVLTAFKRAGCAGILTYFAPQLAALLEQNK